MSSTDLMQARYVARRAVASLSEFVLNDPVGHGTLVEIPGNPDASPDVLSKGLGRIGDRMALSVWGLKHESSAFGR
jgi:hypothetical protein